jgi:predicted transglutaminase-like cysteine proteinase
MVPGRQLSGRALRFLGLLAALALLGPIGCMNPSPRPFVAGAEVQPPSGWMDYCRRNPTDVDCRR